MTSHEPSRAFALGALVIALTLVALPVARGQDPSLSERLAAAPADVVDDELARDLAPLSAEDLGQALELLERLGGADALAPGRRGTLAEALRATPPRAVGAFLEGGLGDEPGVERARAALWMARSSVGAGSLPLLVRLGNTSPDALGPELRATLAVRLRVHPEEVEALADMERRAAEGLVPHLAGALDDAGHREGLGVQVRMLGRGEAVDAQVLASVAALGSRHAAPFVPQVRAAVRRAFDRGGAAVRLEAVRALGVLEDAEAAERLVELLGDADRHLSLAAHRALQRVSGERFASRSDTWRSWLNQEQRWRAERMAPLLTAARQVEIGEASAALRELALHRLYRHELAAQLAEILRDAVPSVAGMACATVAQLGSPAALPVLEDLRDDPELGPAVRAALDSLTRTAEVRD